MSDRDPIETQLDALLEGLDFPVRTETLERAWNLVGETPGEILVIVTFRAKPEGLDALVEAAQVFVESSHGLAGGLFSALYRSPQDPLTLTLVERFADQAALDRHMKAGYFHRFQVAQAPLVRQPTEAVVLGRVPVDFGRNRSSER